MDWKGGDGMKGDIPKWIYTFALLGATLWWAYHTLDVAKTLPVQPSGANIFELTGTSMLLGALVSWISTIIMHWFRKAPPPQTK
jgi:hypothetical protein